jgi:hypothetical protein
VICEHLAQGSAIYPEGMGRAEKTVSLVLMSLDDADCQVAFEPEGFDPHSAAA